MNGLDYKRLALGMTTFLVVVPFLVRDLLPAWIFMWLLALALFFGSKLVTAAGDWRHLGAASPQRILGYLFLWPGMDTRPFLAFPVKTPLPSLEEWIMALVKTAFGAVLLWAVVPRLDEEYWVLRACTGMLAVIFLLHFGLFHVLALAWRTKHVPVRPLMENPARATSLAEFWGRRWNSGFHDLVHHQIFRPVAKLAGAPVAMILVFLVSGLIHELVITVPARAGYGLPTLYFVLQALALMLERSRWGKALGLGLGWRGWLFMFVMTAGPIACLFPPPFLKNVILPMLTSIT